MSENYYGFEKFLSLLDDNNILKNATAMGVMVHLQKCIEEIKSNVLTDLISLDENKKDHYLDLKINEIKRQDYLKNYGKDKIERWLKEFNVNLEDILQNKVESDHFYKMVDGYFEQNFDPGTIEYNTSSAAQNDFLLYFLNYYANKLIAFLESKKNVDNSRKVLGKSKPKKTKEAKVYEEILKGFRELREFENKINEEEFNLDIYLQSNNSETPLSEIHAFDIQCLETNIKSNLEELYTYSLHNDFYYFDCPSKIYINQFEKRKEEFFNRVPDANELDFLLNEVDYFSKPYEYRLLGIDTFYNYDKYIPYSDRYRISLKRKVEFLSSKLKPLNYSISYKENEILSDIFDKDQSWGTQIHAFYDGYTAANKNEVQDEEISKTINEKPSKQLTANQAVLLLDTLGFFNLDKIKNTSKEKQSKLISQLIGRHFKNIKTNIQNLDKKPSELGKNHQKDIDKIYDILNKLE